MINKEALRDKNGRFVKGSHMGAPKGNKAWCKNLKGEEWLKHYKNGHPKGMLGKKNKWGNHTEESKRKISESQKGKLKPLLSETRKRLFKQNKLTPPMLRKHHTEETKKKIHENKERAKKISEKHKGKPNSKKHNKKISLAKKGQIPFWLIGKKNKWGNHTEESKRKISESQKGKKLTKEHFDKLQEGRRKMILPKKDTRIEVKIQDFLKQLGISFFTHQYIKEIKHGYQCDIFVPSINLVIECDGNYWHKYPTGRDIDHIRTSELIEKGFKVLRLWECEIKEIDLNEFKDKIKGFIR